ncbi:hypothetical protein H2248_010817 [Termitomyces sp. 'cryptogamus']|nr:hypothetical protein H2248_010817 [Termitomyces sp. 'cryptogamus']
MGRVCIQCSCEYEERIQAAIWGINEGQYKSYVEEVRDLKANDKIRLTGTKELTLQNSR